MYNKNQEALPVAIDSDLVDKRSHFYHIFRFIKRAYGNDIEKILRSINSILLFGLDLKFIKNKKLRTILRIIQSGIPAAMFSTEFYFSLKKYIKEIKDEQKSAYEQKVYIFSNILNIDKNSKDYGNLCSNEFTLNTEIVFWLLSKPKISSIKILRFYDLNGKELETFNSNEISTGGKDLLILVQYGDSKFLWEIKIKYYVTFPFVDYGVANFVKSLTPIFTEDLFNKIRREIIRDFILILDCKKNVLKFDGVGSIKAFPRIKVLEKINQFDVNSLLIEINNVLKLGRRRAYAFVGKQGTGKSSILRKIGELATNHMVIYISPEDFSNIWKIKDKFELIKILGCCIVIIEDLDGYDFEEKNERATTFLNEIDDVNDDLNAVIIVTINETNKVHKSIIDRPGRFDRVIEIKPPLNNKEVYEILASKFNRLKPIYCSKSKFKLPDLKHIDKSLIAKCISNKFTQAEIANAIMEQIFLDCKKIIERNGQTWNNIKNNFFNERFSKAIDTHMETKRAIVSADFSIKDKNPYEPKEEEGIPAPLLVTIGDR